MFCLGMVSTNLFMFFYVGGIQNSNCAEKDKSRQRCSSTVPLPVKHRHQRMWRLGFTLINVGR